MSFFDSLGKRTVQRQVLQELILISAFTLKENHVYTLRSAPLTLIVHVFIKSATRSFTFRGGLQEAKISALQKKGLSTIYREKAMNTDFLFTFEPRQYYRLTGDRARMLHLLQGRAPSMLDRLERQGPCCPEIGEAVKNGQEGFKESKSQAQDIVYS